MTEELYKKHRPRDFKDVIGQDDAIASLTAMAKDRKFPHTLLLTGGSGCGKTTIGRIIKAKLGCDDNDYREVNAANDRGIELVRDIQSCVGLAPMAGRCRMYLIDEVHQLTPQAQDAFLKLLEDTPKHVYFILATTDPQKLKKTILTRCTQVKLRELTQAEVKELARRVATAEGTTVDDDVLSKLAEVAEGSARRALVLLNQVIGMSDAGAQMAVLTKSAEDVRQAIELARALLGGKPWKEIAAILKDVNDDPEGVRWLVLGYMNSVALGGGGQCAKAICIIESFMEPFYESKAAGLTQACYTALQAVKR